MKKGHRPREIRLSNGIPVIFQHLEGDVAANYWWIQTGSVDENAKEYGFAHFLEHMLFKDAAAKETGQASQGKMACAVEGLGGDINAYTSFEQTVYHVTSSEHHWEKVLMAWGEIAKPQEFLREDFQREREVILEEIKKNEDAPGRALFQKLFTGTYSRHPYGRPVIGYGKTLLKASVRDLEKFYQRNYVPEAMGLVLVGPLTEKRISDLTRILEKRFGKSVLRPKNRVRMKHAHERPERKGVGVEAFSFDVTTPTIALAFRVPELSHPDVPALDLMSGVLSQGELSRLYQKMFYDEALVTDVSGGLYIPKDPGIWYFTLELESPERVLPAAESCLKILAASQQSELSRQDLDRVRVSLESEKVYATQSVDGLASRLGFLRMALGDLEHDQEYLEKIRSLDPEEVQSVASKYLTQDRLQVTLMLPKKSISQASELREWERKLQSVVAAHLPTKNPKAAPTPSKKQTKGALVPEQWTLPSGARVVFVEREQSEVFSIHTTMLGGLRGEWQTSSEHPEEILGASHLLSQTWTKGAGSLDSRAIAHEIESRAAGLDGYSGRHSLGLQLVGLSRDFEPLSQVLSTCLLEPTLPEEELEHSRRVTLDSLKSMEDHSGQLCSRLFLETLFEHHPYRYSTLGTLGSVPKLTREKLLKLYQAWLRPEELVVSISGKVSRRRLDHWLLSLDEKLQQQKTSSPERSSLRVRALSDEPALKGPRWAERKLGREQIHILVGGLGIRLTDVEKYSLRLLQNILGGQSGRMFIELREKRSLAYSVAPTAFEGMEKGYVGTYIACSPSKREEATQGIRKVLEEFARKGPTEAELKRAREYYLGKRVMDLQGDSSLAQSMGLDVLYGLPIKTAAMARKELEKVRTSDLQRFCQKYFLDAPQVTSVVG